MKPKYVPCILMALALIILTNPYQAKAQSPDEARLIAVQEKIDEENPPVNYSSRVEDLARQFQIDPARVNDLRNSGQGWGEITIELSMAEHLTKLDPQNSLTMGEAVDRIGALRAGGEGWGRIAQDLGFKLGPIISAVKSGRYRNPGERNRILLGKTGKTSHIMTQHKVHKSPVRTKQVRLSRPSRPTRLTRVTRPTRPMRPRRPARLGK